MDRIFQFNKIDNNQLISIAGLILTLLIICISVFQFTNSIENGIIQSKKEVMLEQINKLPIQVVEFCTNASNVAVGVWIGEDNLKKEMKEDFMKSKEKQDELFPLVKNSILAYGSQEAIKIFDKFESMIENTNNGQISIEAYYCIPLLISQVKMDVTGEVVNPLVFQKSLMAQFIEHRDKIKSYINQTIDELNLSIQLKIE